MSTQTEHLGLHQWEPSDPFLRTDFNEDFAKIDAGVGEALASAAAAMAAAPCVAGTYQAASNTTLQLGFKPKMVLFITHNISANRSAFAVAMEGMAIEWACTSMGNTIYVTRSTDFVFSDAGVTIPRFGEINGGSGYTVYYAAFR